LYKREAKHGSAEGLAQITLIPPHDPMLKALEHQKMSEEKVEQNKPTYASICNHNSMDVKRKKSTNSDPSTDNK